MTDVRGREEGWFARDYESLPWHVYPLALLMVAIGVITFVIMFAPGAPTGLDLLFLYSIPANTAISVFPHEPVLLYYGKFADLTMVAALATAGTLVAAYLDHRIFVPVLNLRKLNQYKGSRWYQKAVDYFRRYPFATLLVTGFTPIPFFPFKFMAFSVHYPMGRYLLANAVARFPRYWLLAWVGAAFQIPNWLLVAFVAVVFAVYIVRFGPEFVRRRIAKWKQVSVSSEQ